ncbi:MAG: hypothetical protein ACKVP2_09410 [Burkholderiales bacterium]
MVGQIPAFLNWHATRVLRGLNWPFALALVLLAFAAAFYFSALAPVQAHNTSLHAQLEQLRRELAASPANPTQRRDAAADLAEFYRALGAENATPDLLRALHRAAKLQNLAVAKSEYHLVADPGGKLIRYQILMPARGKYSAVRGFLAQAGRDIPGLALDGVNFQRQRIGEEALDAQIKFTLFLGVGG